MHEIKVFLLLKFILRFFHFKIPSGFNIMKRILVFLVATLLTLLSFNSSVFAQTDAIILLNQTSESLGQITVVTPEGNYYANVPAMSTDTVALQDTGITSIIIFGQTIPEGKNAIVTTSAGIELAVIWSSPNQVAVVDRGELG
jgi:hypothetical protein